VDFPALIGIVLVAYRRPSLAKPLRYCGLRHHSVEPAWVHTRLSGPISVSLSLLSFLSN